MTWMNSATMNAMPAGNATVRAMESATMKKTE